MITQWDLCFLETHSEFQATHWNSRARPSLCISRAEKPLQKACALSYSQALRLPSILRLYLLWRCPGDSLSGSVLWHPEQRCGESLTGSQYPPVQVKQWDTTHPPASDWLKSSGCFLRKVLSVSFVFGGSVFSGVAISFVVKIELRQKWVRFSWM